MIKMLDRAMPAAFALAIGLIGQAAQAQVTPPPTDVVPEASSISLLVPSLLVVGGFFLYRAIRAKSAAKS